MEIKYNLERIGSRLLMAALFCFPLLSMGQGGSFSIKVSSDSVGLNDIIKIDIKVENSEGNIEVPKFADFRIISGPNVSTQMSIVNGKKSQKMSYSFMIQPIEVGNVFIEETYLMEGDKVHTLESIPIVVNPSTSVGDKMNISYAREYESTINLTSGEQSKSEKKSNSPKRIKKRI